MKKIDLNADIAEGFPFDESLLKLLSSANIACGLHAGGAKEMQSAVRFAKENQVRIGAHPGFPDRENFGRTQMDLPEQELIAHLRYQLGALKAICDGEGTEISYVKPHGALYNQAAKDEKLARLVAQTIYQFDPSLKLMGLAGSLMLRVAEEEGLQTISEVFADRHYMPDGSLVPRSQPNAMVESDEEAIQQVLQMVTEGQVKAIDGSLVPVKAEVSVYMAIINILYNLQHALWRIRKKSYNNNRHKPNKHNTQHQLNKGGALWHQSITAEMQCWVRHF